LLNNFRDLEVFAGIDCARLILLGYQLGYQEIFAAISAVRSDKGAALPIDWA
jgi:hypothetical protein